MTKTSLLLTFIITILFYGFIIGVVVLSAFPHNPISIPYIKKKQSTILRTFLPEGFGFFTRNPRETQIRIYNIDEYSTPHKIQMQNAMFSNYLGLNKKSRAFNVEIASIIQQLLDQNWITHIGVLNETNRTDHLNFIPMTNQNNLPLLCGKFVIQVADPIPYAWAKNIDDSKIRSQIIGIKISCN